MIAQATAPDRPVHMVFVYALSRFARRLLTQVTAQHKLAKAGVRLVSLVEDLADDPNGKMMRSMIAIMNEKYANDTSVFTCRDRRRNAAAGYWNGEPVPFGYGSHVVVTAGRKGRKKLFVREGALDRIVLDGLLQRVLEPSRPKLLLADVLDRSDDADQRRREDLDRIRRERVAAEARLRRLLELVEEGLMSPRDEVFAGEARGGTGVDRAVERNRAQPRRPAWRRRASH